MIDLDGTLVHSAPEIARGVNAMLVALSLPTLPAFQIEAYIGDGAEKLIKRALTQPSDCEPDTALFVQAKQLFFTAKHLYQCSRSQKNISLLAACHNTRAKIIQIIFSSCLKYLLILAYDQHFLCQQLSNNDWSLQYI